MITPKESIILQVRMNSSRLPGKALSTIHGKTLLWRLVQRIKKSSKKKIIISTSCNSMDEKIIREAKKLKLDYFTGKEDDCLDRFIKTACHYNVDIIVRVTGDNPFTDPFHIERAISYLKEKKLDYVGMKGLPLGTAAEVVKLDILKKVQKTTCNKYHKENITSFIYSTANMFNLGFIKPSEKYLVRPDLRLTVDTKEDLELIKKIFSHLGDYPSLHDIIKLIDSHKNLFFINCHIKQKKNFI